MKVRKLTQDETKKFNQNENLIASMADKVQTGIHGNDYFWFGSSCIILPAIYNYHVGEINFFDQNWRIKKVIFDILPNFNFYEEM
jgi:hypothetical protein